jgi:hypothetical protein
VFILPEANSTGTLNLQFQGNNSQSFKVRGVAVGNAAVEFADSAGLLLPTDITTVFVAGTTFVLNPSFELDKDSGVGTAAVTGWTTSGANIGMAEIGNPFLAADDLTIPDRRKVLRIQGNGGTVSQMINGLAPGKLYGLQFFYNARSFGYPYELDLQVSFAGQQLANIQDLYPAAYDGLTDFYFRELRFTPSAASGLLEFKTTVRSGDATLFLDAVSIVPRVTGEIAVMNSSFEGSAMGANWPGYLQPERIAGWICGGGGYGVNAYSPKTFFVEPFFDNGINSDQDHVAFGQGGVTFRQLVSGLSPGQTYTLVFDYNNRDGRPQNSSIAPNLGQLEVLLDGEVLFVSDEFEPADTVSPWPGFRHTKPFRQAFIPIIPFMDSADLLIAHTGVAGDETLLIDNVRIVPGNISPPAITKELSSQTAKAGETINFAVTASGSNLSYRWLQDGVPLVDGAGISGASTASLALSNVQLPSNGTYTVLVSNGFGLVGSAAELQIEASATVEMAVGQLANGNVRISWPSSASGFQLQSATAVNGPYSNNTATVTTEGGQNVVILTPQGSALFLRLSN